MKNILLTTCLLFFFNFNGFNQTPSQKAIRWADSVFNSLNDDQRIAQLMILRESTFSRNGPIYHDSLITQLILKYNIGGICLFQGTPVKQADFINYFQSIAQTPLMVCVDAEWGLGMRFDSVTPLNHQMMLGAVNNPALLYQYGKLVGEQCVRMGIQVNYAPVVDINNNPNNPVINDRSFGEDKYKVAEHGIAYMKGMQDAGILTCAKHFPGHGDVAVDSHYDLPVINKTLAQLDSLELYPFKKMIEAGVGSVMIAHLYVPAIDSTANRATSLSKNNVTGLLRNQLQFGGLTFTDALDMKGVSKFFPGGEIAAQSLIAGNDMLCLPEDVPAAIDKIKEAINHQLLSWDDIYEKCKKVLYNKYLYGMAQLKPINTNNLTADLNAGIDAMKQQIAEEAITVLNNQDKVFFPLQIDESKKADEKKIAYIGFGINADNTFSQKMREEYQADVFFFDYKEDASRIASTAALIKDRYQQVVIGVHNYSRYPANQFGISNYALDLIQQIQQNNTSILFDFGNPYALKNFCKFNNLVACYEDDSITQKAAFDLLKGKINPQGTLPVTVCEKYSSGSGIVVNSFMPRANPEQVGLSSSKLNIIDSIARAGVTASAYPGCVVLIAKEGKVVYEKSFGNYASNSKEPVMLNSVFDLASVTKICATTLAVMKLYDEGKLKLNKTLGDYLPSVKGTNKQRLNIEKILLHQAGLNAFIPFYKETIDPVTQIPSPALYRSVKSDSFSIKVANDLYLRNDWEDTIYKRILTSKLGPTDKYVYSDNDFIFMGKVVEAISGLPLDQYVANNFYKPMSLQSTGFKPLDFIDKKLIVPTENEKYFRQQLLLGNVHDPGAALMGGVAGHAGLFSNAENIAVILQMLLNGGNYNGKQYLKAETIQLFTSYNSTVSRRGIGFDKPQKDNYTTKDWDPYPSRFASPLTYGHTGYTGTCIWVDPKYDLVYVFLSNRVNPDGGTNLKLSSMNIRGNIEDAIYKAMVPEIPEVLKRTNTIETKK